MRTRVVQGLEVRMMLSNFTVTDTFDDADPGSLRGAIGQVDSDPSPGVNGPRGIFSISRPSGLLRAPRCPGKGRLVLSPLQEG